MFACFDRTKVRVCAFFFLSSLFGMQLFEKINSDGMELGWRVRVYAINSMVLLPAVSAVLPISVVGLFVFGAHAFTVPWCTRLLAGHGNAHLRPSLTCTYFWADDRRWASLSARSFVCTGFAPRNFKKGSADRPLFCLLVFARGFHMIFQHMCWSSHVCTSHVETMLDGEERMHT